MKYTKEYLEEIIQSNNNIKDCLLKMGRQTSGDNYNYFSRLVKKFEIDISHFLSRSELHKIARDKRGGAYRDPIDLKDILIKDFDGTYGGNNLKSKLYKEGLKIPCCELCGQDENWITGKISLILDHINGDNKDNRINNLRIVCPNCDAALPTFKGKNRKSNSKKIQKKNEILRVKEEEIQRWKYEILKHNINFSKKNWGIEVSKIMNKCPQWCLKFVKTNLKELINTPIV